MIKLPSILKSGDKVRFLSPASFPEKEAILYRSEVLKNWGLEVDFGQHAFDTHGFLAGNDEHRLSDFNEALRDPSVRGIIATRGGKGSYRIADKLDFSAWQKDPKIIVGFSDITAIHLSIFHHCAAPGIHGSLFGGMNEVIQPQSEQSFKACLMDPQTLRISRREHEPTAAISTSGQAHGVLIGGNLEMISTLAGWALPSLEGCILMLEDVEKYPGQIDRMLVQLINSGALKGVVGVAVAQFAFCRDTGSMNAIDILRDHLHTLEVPVLGGLPIGHGHAPVSVPHGTPARLNVDEGWLEIEPALR